MLEEMDGESIRTTGQWMRQLDKRMNNLEERIQPFELAKHAFFGASRRRFEGYAEKALKELHDIGLSRHQIDDLKKYGLLAVDNVTGFQEGRSGPGRFETLNLAILHVTETKERAFYVEMDLKNLGGLNARLGHTRTNEIFSKIAGLIQVFLTGAGQDPVFFRHGGDEMSAMIFDTTEGRLQVAINQLHRAVQELAEQYHLQDIENPKHPGDPRFCGIGVHFGIVEIKAEFADYPQRIFQLADLQLEGNKKAPLPNPTLPCEMGRPEGTPNG